MSTWERIEKAAKVTAVITFIGGYSIEVLRIREIVAAAFNIYIYSARP